jgi:hypothetical protein
MHDPRKPHLALVKRILRYLKGSIDHDLQLHRSVVTSLVAYSVYFPSRSERKCVDGELNPRHRLLYHARRHLLCQSNHKIHVT